MKAGRESLSAAPVDLMANLKESLARKDDCEHGCGREGLVEHADGRMLCLPCYSREVGIAASRNAWCDTCYPRGEHG